MKIFQLFLITFLLIGMKSVAQVGIGTTSPKALVDFSISTNAPTKSDGLIPPRLENYPSSNPDANQLGLLTTIARSFGKDYMYWDGLSWIVLTNRDYQKINDMVDGKSDNDGTDNFSSVYLGRNAGLSDDQSDNRNVGVGYGAMFFGTTAEKNVAVGYESLNALTSGYGNTALGYRTLYNNTANENTAIGYAALTNNTTASFNTAAGSSSLYFNTTGEGNTAVGDNSLHFNTIGNYNSALGTASLFYNTQGNNNNAMGYYALLNNTTGDNNVGIGSLALVDNQISNDNVAIGSQSLTTNTATRNTAVGYRSGQGLATGTFNTFVGADTQTSVNNVINSTAIGYQATVTGNNMIRFGNSGVTSIGGWGNWTNVSDERFKYNVKEDIVGLDFILALQPVTYDLDIQVINNFIGINKSKQIQREQDNRQIGFIAQEVEAIAKKTGFKFHGIDSPNNDSDFYGLRYAEFVVPLVKAVQEQQEAIEINEAIIASLEKQLNELDVLKERVEILKALRDEN